MDTKAFWKSTGFWGTILTVALTVYNGLKGQFGWPDVPEWLYGVFGAVGLYGRATATAPLGLADRKAGN